MKNAALNGTSLYYLQMTTNCSSENINVFLNEIQALRFANILLCLLSFITAVIAVSANGLVIWAISRTTSLHNPSNILLCCLATTDLLTGLLTQTASGAAIVGLETGKYQVYCTAYQASISVGYYLSGVSFLILTAVSFDRCLALHLHLRYRELVTISKVLVAVVGFWLTMAVFTVVTFKLGLHVRDTLVTVIGLTGLIINLICYAIILKTIARHESVIINEAQLAARFQGRSIPDIKALSKSSKTMLLVFLLFCACYIPSIINAFVSAVSFKTKLSTSRKIFYEFANFLVALNSSLNPLLFCFRISEIRQAALNLFKN